MSLGRFKILQTILSDIDSISNSNWISPNWMFPIHRLLAEKGEDYFYGIAGVAHAREYLSDPILGPALRNRVIDILVSPERENNLRISKEALPVFRSSMTLFRSVDQDPEQVFNYALRRLGAGECRTTISLILEEYKSPFTKIDSTI